MALSASATEWIRQLEVFELRLTNLEKAAKGLASPIVSRQDRWMSAREVARYLSVSTGTVHNWTKQGRLVKHKAGRVARYDRNEVDRCMDSFSSLKSRHHD